MDGVRPGQRAGLVGEPHDPLDIGGRAHRVRRDREPDDPCPVGEEPCEIVVVDLELFGHPGDPDDDAEIVGELEPRGDVPVVIERRHDHFVALVQCSREGSREQEVERRHARAERDLFRRAGEERRRTLARTCDQLVGMSARLVGRADVGVGLAQVPGDRVDHLVRALRPTWPVEERKATVECAEARTYCAHVERRRAHVTGSPLTVQW